MTTEHKRTRAEWGDGLLTWGFVITIAVIALVGFGLLASVKRPGVSALPRSPSPTSRLTLQSPQLENRLPSVELRGRPAVSGDCLREGARAPSDRGCSAAAKGPDVKTNVH